mmetsp:Transcript_14158/g.30893  ORF Transcript_14158/g.30893 Transcript_14158/m.30893 type:complete len:332 (+) Transcript_14158:1451-2446(+)
MHIVRRIFHKDGRIGIRLGHFFLPRLESVQHVMRQDNGFVFNARRIAIFSRQHIHLSLIDAQLTNARLEEKHVRTLHEGVQNLGRRERAFESSHDLTTFFDARHVESSRHVEHGGPVHVRLLGDFFRRPFEHDIGQIHPGRLPNFNEVVSDRLDLVQIAAHLVVHEGEPIGHPKDKGGIGTGVGAFVHVHGLEDTLGNVHATGGFKAVVEIERLWWFVAVVTTTTATPPALGGEQLFEFFRGNAFFTDGQDALVILFQFVGPRTGGLCRGRSLGFLFLLLLLLLVLAALAWILFVIVVVVGLFLGGWSRRLFVVAIDTIIAAATTSIGFGG